MGGWAQARADRELMAMSTAVHLMPVVETFMVIGVIVKVTNLRKSMFYAKRCRDYFARGHKKRIEIAFNPLSDPGRNYL